MFTPLPQDKFKMMEENGTIKFFVYHGWEFVAASALFTTIPHKIAYVPFKEGFDRHLWLFDCKFSIDKYSVIIEDLFPHADDSFKISKAMEYMFLTLTLKEAEKLTTLHSRTRLYIASPISTFSEIASELEFTVKRIPNTNTYKAQKLFR